VSTPAVRFDGVWKKFRRGQRHDSLRDLIPFTVQRLIGRTNGSELAGQEFWALEDVSFEVQPGEALGIIGPNGAGKSTTLKLLTRILRPTRGHCEVRGRIGALIEIAAGFHPDLTGRENIFLQGAVMGMKRHEVARRIEEIVEFAGIGSFIDTQVKRYSSGMNARLGFSIAAHLEPDVLIIDEVLAVGDMAFQQKCLERMRQYRKEGAAIVFVSHQLNSIVTLCSKALLMKHRVLERGDAVDVVRLYMSLMGSGQLAERMHEGFRTDAALLDERGQQIDSVSPGQRVTFRVIVEKRGPLPDRLVFGFMVHRAEDRFVVSHVDFDSQTTGWREHRDEQSVVLSFDFVCHLLRGVYDVGLLVFDPARAEYLLSAPHLKTLSVHETTSYAGVAELEPRLSLRRVAGAQMP
jgi:lipopolysaccharide transport system ATP-binding protein